MGIRLSLDFLKSDSTALVTLSVVLREREASPLDVQMPRNSTTELSITYFLWVILRGKGDIAEVDGQLEQSEHFQFHLKYENWKEKTGPLTALYQSSIASEVTLVF